MSEIATAPLVSWPIAIDPAWIDYNGHLNVAFYNAIFDRSAAHYEPAKRAGRRIGNPLRAEP